MLCPSMRRILEVLPDHMPQVCLLPNGRWRMVWSQVGLDFGQNDTKLTTVGIHLPFTSIFKDDSYVPGQAEEFRHNSCKAGDHCLDYQQSCGCREVQILHRAYKTWKDGVEHPLSRGGTNAEQSKVQWGAESTIALWTGNRTSSWDTFWQPSPQRVSNNRYPATSRLSGGINDSVNDIEVDPVGDSVVQTAEETETSNCQKINAGEKESIIASTSKMRLDGLPSPKEVASICARGQLRIGQHKSRPKLMAKRT